MKIENTDDLTWRNDMEPPDGSLVLVYDRVFRRIGSRWEQVVTRRVREDGLFVRYFEWNEIVGWGCRSMHTLPPLARSRTP